MYHIEGSTNQHNELQTMEIGKILGEVGGWKIQLVKGKKTSNILCSLAKIWYTIFRGSIHIFRLGNYLGT